MNGEATVLQVFTIAVKGQKEGQVVAGCRVGNGVVGKGDVVRVLRGEGREVVFEGQSPSLLSGARWVFFLYRVSGSDENRSLNDQYSFIHRHTDAGILLPVCAGPLESLRHLKKEINEARKGSECGMVVDGFKDVKEGDQIVSITKVEKAQQL